MNAEIDQLALPRPAWFDRALGIERREHSVQVDGVDIHGFSWGDPSKPGVVLLHGMMAHARCWAFVAPLLAKDYHLAALDFSGMGDSGWRDSYSLEQRADEALGFANALGMRGPTLVCHSFGGSVGLTAVERAPDAWSRIIICDMSMVRPEDLAQFNEMRSGRPGSAMGAPQRRGHRIYADLPSALQRFRLAPDQPCENDYLVEYMGRHSLKPTTGGWVWKFDPGIIGAAHLNEDSFWLNLAPRFAAIKQPKAMIYGEQSALFGDPVAKYLGELCADNTPIVEIPTAHHHLMLDQPQALTATLATLLQTLHP